MQYVRINVDETGRKYVRELIPKEATPINEWYPEHFCKECVEAPDDVVQNMLYDASTGGFYPWVPCENDERQRVVTISDVVKEALSDI